MSFETIPSWEETFFASRQAKQSPTAPTPPDGTHFSVTATVREKDGKWCAFSESGKNFGCYGTKAEAEKRVMQMEMFKHIKKGLLLRKTGAWEFARPMPGTFVGMKSGPYVDEYGTVVEIEGTTARVSIPDVGTVIVDVADMVNLDEEPEEALPAPLPGWKEGRIRVIARMERKAQASADVGQEEHAMPYVIQYRRAGGAWEDSQKSSFDWTDIQKSLFHAVLGYEGIDFRVGTYTEDYAGRRAFHTIFAVEQSVGQIDPDWLAEMEAKYGPVDPSRKTAQAFTNGLETKPNVGASGSPASKDNLVPGSDSQRQEASLERLSDFEKEILLKVKDSAEKKKKTCPACELHAAAVRGDSIEARSWAAELAKPGEAVDMVLQRELSLCVNARMGFYKQAELKTIRANPWGTKSGVCARCSALNGTTVDTDDPFAPKPPFHDHCACELV